MIINLIVVKKNYKGLIAATFIFNSFKIAFLRYCRKNLFLSIIINNKKIFITTEIAILKICLNLHLIFNFI